LGQKKIIAGVEVARKNAFIVEKELCDLKLIVFSDHHRGSRDGADDFLR